MILTCMGCGRDTGVPFEDLTPWGVGRSMCVGCKEGQPLPLQRRNATLDFRKAQTFERYSPRFIGVELEMFHHLHNTDRALQLSTDWRLMNCGICEDGSIRSNAGIEVKSPPAQGDDIPLWLTNIVRIALSYGMRVDASCGVHVHVEVKDFDANDFRRLFLLTRQWEPIIYAILPPNRWMGTYGGPMRLGEKGIRKMTSMAHVEHTWANQNGHTRYRGLNFEAYKKYKTVEFRYHSGTLNIEKLLAWTCLCQRIVDGAKRLGLNQIPTQFEGFEDRLKRLSTLTKVESLIPYLERRMTHFEADTAAIERWYTERNAELDAVPEPVRIMASAPCPFHPLDHRATSCTQYSTAVEMVECFNNAHFGRYMTVSDIWYTLPLAWVRSPFTIGPWMMRLCFMHAAIERVTTPGHDGECGPAGCRATTNRDRAISRYMSDRRTWRRENGWPPDAPLPPAAPPAAANLLEEILDGPEAESLDDDDHDPDDDGGTNEEDT